MPRKKVFIYNIEKVEKKKVEDEGEWEEIGKKKKKEGNVKEENKKIREELNNYLDEF